MTNICQDNGIKMAHFTYKQPDEVLFPDLRSSIILIDNTTLYFPKVQLTANVGREAHLFYDSLIGKQVLCACHKDIYDELKNVILSPVESSGKIRTEYLLSLFKLLYWPPDKKRSAITQSIAETIGEIKRRKSEQLSQGEVETAIEAYIASTKDLIAYSKKFVEPSIFVVETTSIPDVLEIDGVLFFPSLNIGINVGEKSKYILELIQKDYIKPSSHEQVCYEIKNCSKDMILYPTFKRYFKIQYFMALVRLLYSSDSLHVFLLEDIEKARNEVRRIKQTEIHVEKVKEAVDFHIEQKEKLISFSLTLDVPVIYIINRITNSTQISEKDGVLFFRIPNISIDVGIKSKYILELILNDSFEPLSHREICREIKVTGKYMAEMNTNKIQLYVEYFNTLVKLLYLPNNFNFCLLDDVEKSRTELHRRKASRMNVEKVLEAVQIHTKCIKKIINYTCNVDLPKYTVPVENKVIISTTNLSNISWTKKGHIFILEGQFTVSHIQ